MQYTTSRIKAFPWLFRLDILARFRVGISEKEGSRGKEGVGEGGMYGRGKEGMAQKGGGIIRRHFEGRIIWLYHNKRVTRAKTLP